MTQLPPENENNQQPNDQPIVPQQPVVPPLAPTQGNPNVLGGQPVPPQQPQPPHFSAPQMPQAPQPTQAPQMPQASQPLPPQQPQQAPQYGAPQAPFGQQPGQPGQPVFVPKPPTNTMAIVAFVGSFFVALVGIICGHIALKQIKQTGEGGRGFALAGTIIGYVVVGLSLIGVILSIFAVGIFGSIFTAAAGEAISQSDQYTQELEELEDNTDLDLSANPWDGTADAAFCDAVMNYDLDFDDPKYYEDILAEAKDADFKSLAQEQADYLNRDIDALDIDEYSKYAESFAKFGVAQAEQIEYCFGL